jgi:glutathione S-transferase
VKEQMMTASQYPLTTLALVAALFVYGWISINVGRARAQFGVPAPQSGGHPEFDKRYRVQVNTVEQSVLLIPGVLLGTPVLGDLFAGTLVAIWTVGRILFALAYYKDPAKRGPGFAMTFIPGLMLVIAAAKGAVTALI